MLDLRNDSELCEGKTTEIFVSRYRLFDDAMEEILRDDPPAIDFSVPLEVIFTGEGAQENGLGEKKLQIPTNASKEQVKEVLYK